jgi:hypothetical protein
MKALIVILQYPRNAGAVAKTAATRKLNLLVFPVKYIIQPRATRFLGSTNKSACDLLATSGRRISVETVCCYSHSH